jgi:hypothetical protein
LALEFEGEEGEGVESCRRWGVERRHCWRLRESEVRLELMTLLLTVVASYI